MYVIIYILKIDLSPNLLIIYILSVAWPLNYLGSPLVSQLTGQSVRQTGRQLVFLLVFLR